MTYTSGGAYYNQFVNSATAGIIVKGIQNATLYNNTIYTGSSISGFDAGIDIKSNGVGEVSAGTISKNNIIYALSGRLVYIEDAASGVGFVSDNNLYYSWSGSNIGMISGSVVAGNFASWQAAGFDTHGAYADPLFINIGTSDYRLQRTSPAINIGVGLGFSRDLINTSVPQGSLPDAGAYEYVPLTVTINQAAGQSDPTNSTINFTVIFSESVSDFAAGDVTLSGTAGATTATVTGSGTTYNIAVTGMTGSGTIIATLAAGVATGATGNTNVASTSTDNTVSYDVTAPTVPGTPTTTSPTNNNKPTWTWTASTDAGSGLATTPYTLQWSQDSNFGSGVSSTTSNTNSFTHVSSLADGTWYFKVKAADILGNNSAYSSNGSVVVDTAAPTITIGTPTPNSTGATIVWTTNEDSSSKVDYGLTTSYGSSTTETDTITRVQSHSVTLSGLSSCTTYHYRVRSIDTALNETIDLDNTFITTGCTTSSSSSNTSSSTSNSVCNDQAPGSKAPWLYGAIAQDSGSVLLYFTEADNPVNKYVLEYGTQSGNYPYGVQDMGVNSRGQMTFLVKLLSPNTTYYFRVRGGNGCATGSWSNEISAKTKGLVSFNQLEITQSELKTQPATETPANSCQTYTVKSGDTLWSIAKNLLGDGNKYKAIIEQNKDKYSSLETSNNLSSGWELKINCGKQAVTEETKKSTETRGGYDVKVKVVDTNKKPLEGASVTLHSTPQTAKTNNAGIAEFKNVEAGDHKVLIAYNNFEGEQSVNLTGDVKEFDLNVTVQQKAISLSPLAYGIIGIMGLVIIGLIVLVIKLKRKE